MGKASRQELVEAVRQRYATAGRSDKRRILDEFVALTGFHRKHSIRLLGADPSEAGAPRTHARVYADDVRSALLLAWEASDRLCGKRLKAALPVLLAALERHGHWTPSERLRLQLGAISAVKLPPHRGHDHYAAADRIWLFNSYSIGLAYPMDECRRRAL